MEAKISNCSSQMNMISFADAVFSPLSLEQGESVNPASRMSTTEMDRGARGMGPWRVIPSDASTAPLSPAGFPCRPCAPFLLSFRSPPVCSRQERGSCRPPTAAAGELEGFVFKATESFLCSRHQTCSRTRPRARRPLGAFT